MAIAFQDKQGRCNGFLLPAPWPTHCIHGVDIDQQAVEVTVYVALSENAGVEAAGKLGHALGRTGNFLPPLDNNIRCGNSLIDEEGYFQFRESIGKNQRSLFENEDDDTRFRINRFDWTSRTSGLRLLDAQAVEERGRTGFDCVIGNPPYIRVQELNKWAPKNAAITNGGT